MKTLKIKRCYLDSATVGFVEIEDFKCVSLELPWRYNKKNISCIPSGMYKCRKITSGKNGECFEVQNVFDRTNVQGHIGNFTSDIQGCIIFGDGIRDINKDGVYDITSSRVTFGKLMAILPGEFILEVGLC